MPRAKQLMVSVPDRPGMLGEVAGALGAKKINIRGMMAWVEGDKGHMAMVVDKTAAAKKLFGAMGWENREDEVLMVTLGDTPGTLGKVAAKLGAAGVNVFYSYAGSAGSARKLNAFFSVSDMKAALKAAR